MRHAHKNAATNEEPKPSLVPKLRFPEFEGAGAWASRTFGDVTTKTDKRNKGGISYPVYSISNKAGFVPQSEQFAGVDSEKRGYDLAQYKLVGRNTFAYNPARINVGSIGFSGDLENVIVSSLYVCFKSNLEADDQFLQHFFSTRMFERSVCNHAEGGIRSYLFYENFSRIEILLPTLPEQQRIASCLSSLDELITAQAQKVGALKTHKKGLMQQLFPREGETLPRLRFPEFEGAGEWTQTALNSIADPVMERATQGDKDNVLSLSAEYGIVPQSEFFGKKVAGDNAERYLKIARNDFVYNDRTTKASTFGTIKRLSKHSGGIVSPIYKCFRFHADENPMFWEQYFESGNHDAALWGLVNEGARAGRFNISISQFLSTVACLPDKSEQQRIAYCLASLDELIKNESHKLDTYMTHKKGLMQGLFPKVEEGDA